MIRRCAAEDASEHGTRSTLPRAMCNQLIFGLLEKRICFYIMGENYLCLEECHYYYYLQNKGIVELKASQFGLVKGPV